jgi:hypothetical protein
MNWLPAAASGGTALDRVLGLCPELRADYRAFRALCCAAVDPDVLELCRLRVIRLVGGDEDASLRDEPVAGATLDAPKLAALSAWPTSSLFTPCERACLEFAEQFVMDPHGVSEAQAAAVSAHLGAPGLVALTEALALFEGFARVGAMLIPGEPARR